MTLFQAWQSLATQAVISWSSGKSSDGLSMAIFRGQDHRGGQRRSTALGHGSFQAWAIFCLLAQSHRFVGFSCQPPRRLRGFEIVRPPSLNPAPIRCLWGGFLTRDAATRHNGRPRMAFCLRGHRAASTTRKPDGDDEGEGVSYSNLPVSTTAASAWTCRLLPRRRGVPETSERRFKFVYITQALLGNVKDISGFLEYFFPHSPASPRNWERSHEHNARLPLGHRFMTPWGRVSNEKNWIMKRGVRRAGRPSWTDNRRLNSDEIAF